MARLQQMTLTRGNRGLLLLAVVAGLVTAVLVFLALAQDDDNDGGTVSLGGTTSQAVVAKQNISQGTEITADMVQVLDVPESLLVRNAFADTTLVVGQKARVPISSGAQINGTMIGVQSSDEGASYVIPAGKRALAVEVEEVTAVGGLLRAGDHVDVIASFPRPNDQSNLVVTVLQDVEVLAVAQKSQEPVPVADGADADAPASAQTSGQLPDDQEDQPDANSVTLIVDPQQAQLLVAAQEEADKVWLSLRPFGESGAAEVPSLDVNTLANR
jgi:pilus assembly protein CpaB